MSSLMTYRIFFLLSSLTTSDNNKNFSPFPVRYFFCMKYFGVLKSGQKIVPEDKNILSGMIQEDLETVE